jgi:hypothetical protein
MLGYTITSAICLFLLVMIPIWSEQGQQPQYPFAVILFLAVIVLAVPMVLRRRRREGAADPGALAVTVDTLPEVDAANQRRD